MRGNPNDVDGQADAILLDGPAKGVTRLVRAQDHVACGDAIGIRIRLQRARRPVPRQELVEPCGGVICDAGEDIGEPCLRVDIVELGGLDQRVDDGGALTATIRAAEQPSLAAEWDAAKGALGGVVAEADPAVVEEAGERVPALEHVEAGLGQIMAAR